MNLTHSAHWIASNQPEAGIQPAARFLLKKVCWFLIDTLTKTNQPAVWSTCDRTGRVWRYVYDPTTGLSSHLLTE